MLYAIACVCCDVIDDISILLMFVLLPLYCENTVAVFVHQESSEYDSFLL